MHNLKNTAIAYINESEVDLYYKLYDMHPHVNAASKVSFEMSLLGPKVTQHIENKKEELSWTFWGYMAVVCLGAMMYSAISFLLFWFGVHFLAGRPAPLRRKRVQVSVWATILAIAPFPILFGRNHPDWALMAELCGCYWIPLMAGMWIFPFPTTTARKLEGRQPSVHS